MSSVTGKRISTELPDFIFFMDFVNIVLLNQFQSLHWNGEGVKGNDFLLKSKRNTQNLIIKAQLSLDEFTNLRQHFSHSQFLLGPALYYKFDLSKLKSETQLIWHWNSSVYSYLIFMTTFIRFEHFYNLCYYKRTCF